MDEETLARIKDSTSLMMEQILDYVSIAVPDPDTWKVVRSKILRVGNNALRRIDDISYGEVIKKTPLPKDAKIMM
jgi:hypothetical protein